jgi:GNAT superfamily N-acetyltransferase
MPRAVPAVRDASLDDARDLLVLARTFVTSFPLDDGPFHESLERLLGHRDAMLLVVGGERGHGTGYLLAFVHDTIFATGLEAWCEEGAVEPSVRRQDCGRALTEECERRTLARGAKLVGLAPRRALPFCGSLAYEKSGTYLRKLR